MKTTASGQDVLNFIVAKANASEENPLRLGNVEFWHEVPSCVAGILCYSIPTNKWDLQAVQGDLNTHASQCWDELVSYLNSKVSA